MDKRYEKLAHLIASEIVFSNSYGKTMKKWRELFNISQTGLSEYLGINPSTISDYESERRKNPGINVVKRFVLSLIEIDLATGGKIVNKYVKDLSTEQIYYVHEFASVINGLDFIKLIGGKVITNEDILERVRIYGFTLVNSLQAIMEIQSDDFPKLFGSAQERAFIFTDVSTGRSPLVVIHINKTKPSIVVLHGIEEEQLDKLAIALAKRERIPLVVTTKKLSEIENTLKKL
jgi:putative transcriptional regulator